MVATPRGGGGGPSDALASALTLRAVPGLGAARFRGLIDRFGDPESALAAPLEEFAEVAGGLCARSRGVPGLEAPARALMDRCRRAGIRCLVFGQPGYPRRLGDLADPPSVLFAVGRTGLLDRSCVAVVGSRRATAYGRRVARRLGGYLVSQGRCVVSGLALGIDGEAHRGALPGPTIAVLGSGVDVVSPPSHGALYREIVETGLVISEYDPGARAAPHHFPERNRIIAALAADVVVVEASGRSGALITAAAALDLGRDVHAVPGPIDRPTSVGTNRLIADGAGVVTDVEGGDGLVEDERLPPEPELRRLLACFPGTPLTADEAARQAGIPVEEALAHLTILEVRGFVNRTRDGRLMRTPGRRWAGSYGGPP